MKISKKVLRELYQAGSLDDFEGEIVPVKFISCDHIKNTRWSKIEQLVIQDLSTLRYYTCEVSSGLTECQDEQPFEYENDEIELEEVWPSQVVKTIWLRKTPHPDPLFRDTSPL